MERRVMCLLLSGQSLCNYVPRLGLVSPSHSRSIRSDFCSEAACSVFFSLLSSLAPACRLCLRRSVFRSLRLRLSLTCARLQPYIVPFIVADRGYSDAQRAQLLAAFFPGYLLTQIPLGFLAQLWGAKSVLSLNLVGTCAMLAALPSATAAGARGVWACLFTLGLFQGPFVPAGSLMKRSWVPSGPEKAMALLLIGLGSKASRMVSSTVTPVLCDRAGWRQASYIYAAAVGAFTILWQLVARNEPRDRAVEQQQPQANGDQKPEETKGKEKTFEPRVFRVASIHAVMWSHFAANNTEYTLMQWAPTYFNQVLNVPLGSVGTYLAAPATVNLVGNILVAMLESLLVSRGVGELAIRKGASMLAAVSQAVSIVLFGMARTPLTAMLAYCGVVGGGCFHNSGYGPNYLEVGGPDTGVVSAVGNTLANAPGMVGPIIAVWAVRQMSERASWMPLFVGTAVIQLVAGAFFQLCGSITPAREELA